MKLKYTFVLFSLLFCTQQQLSAQLNCLDDLSFDLGLGQEVTIIPFQVADVDPDDFVYIGTTSEITYTCEDIGNIEYEVYGVLHNQDTIYCTSTINITSSYGTITVIDADVSISYDGQTSIQLTPEMFDEGSYGVCSDIVMTIEPSVVECNSPENFVAVLTATDEHGNSSQAWASTTIDDYTSTDYECAQIDYISIDEGDYELTTNDLLIKGNPCLGNFSITITSSEGPVPTDNIFTTAHVGFTYSVTIEDANTGFICSSDFVVTQGTVPYTICVNDVEGMPISNVQIGESNTFTDDTGCAVFSADFGTEISFTKEGDNLEGVDVADFTLMFQHVLGEITLSDVAIFAGDINLKNSLTSLDAVLLKKTIEGSLDQNFSWFFYDLQNGIPETPKLYEGNQNFSLGNRSAINVLAVKKGDVDFSYNQLISSSSETASLYVDDIVLNEGEFYKIPLILEEDVSLIALQTSLLLETDDYKITNITSTIPNYTFDGIENVDNGLVDIIWMSDDASKGTELKSGKAVFEVEIKAKNNSILHQTFKTIETQINKIVFQGQTNSKVLDITFENIISVPTIDIDDNHVSVHPNPVLDRLNITSLNPANTVKEGKVYTVDGKIILNTPINNEKSIDLSNLKPGTYILNLTLSNGHEMNKLIQKQ